MDVHKVSFPLSPKLVNHLLRAATACSYRARVRKSRYWGGNASVPLPLLDVTWPPYLFSGELCTSPFACLCTPCAVGSAVSASLCSEHVNETSYWRSGRQKWEKLRHRTVTQCATLAHPCYRVMMSHGACTSGTSRILTIASLHRLKMEILIPAPAD